MSVRGTHRVLQGPELAGTGSSFTLFVACIQVWDRIFLVGRSWSSSSVSHFPALLVASSTGICEDYQALSTRCACEGAQSLPHFRRPFVHQPNCWSYIADAILLASRARRSLTSRIRAASTLYRIWNGLFAQLAPATMVFSGLENAETRDDCTDCETHHELRDTRHWNLLRSCSLPEYLLLRHICKYTMVCTPQDLAI